MTTAKHEATMRDPRDLVEKLRMVIRAAYAGSAEHGSFLRHGGGEMNPNAFMVLEDVEAALKVEGQAASSAGETRGRMADAVVTRLYRRFKEWSQRGFGPEDVTWCEVKADVVEMIALASPSHPQTTEKP